MVGRSWKWWSRSEITANQKSREYRRVKISVWWFLPWVFIALKSLQREEPVSPGCYLKESPVVNSVTLALCLSESLTLNFTSIHRFSYSRNTNCLPNSVSLWEIKELHNYPPQDFQTMLLNPMIYVISSLEALGNSLGRRTETHNSAHLRYTFCTWLAQLSVKYYWCLSESYQKESRCIVKCLDLIRWYLAFVKNQLLSKFQEHTSTWF